MLIKLSRNSILVVRTWYNPRNRSSGEETNKNPIRNFSEHLAVYSWVISSFILAIFFGILGYHRIFQGTLDILLRFLFEFFTKVKFCFQYWLVNWWNARLVVVKRGFTCFTFFFEKFGILWLFSYFLEVLKLWVMG